MNSKQQVALKEWQQANFDNSELESLSKDELISLVNKLQMALGMAEEVGEVARALLKHSQKIRGRADHIPVVEITDGVIDSNVYGTQLLSMLNVDVEKATDEVITEVMSRDWKADPDGLTLKSVEGL